MSFSQVIAKFDEFENAEFDFGVDGSDFLQIGKCKSLINDIFNGLNWAIITGDYTNVTVTKSFIEEAEGKIQILLSLYSDSHSASKKKTQEILFDGFVKPINYSLLHLKHLISVLENRLDSEEIQILNKHNYEYPKPKRDSFDISKQVTLFRVNCDVARFDHTISISEEYLHQMILLLESIKSKLNGFLPFNEILEDKCKLLIFKVAKKLDKQEKNITYQFNLKKYGLGDSIESNYYFKDLIKDYKRHYQATEDSKNLQEKRLSEAYKKQRRGEDLSLINYHVLIKHYKDKQKNLEQINNLIDEVDQRYTDLIDEESDLYSKRAWQIALNYFLNNKLSFILKSKNRNVDDIKDLMVRIELIQEQTKVYNFFPYWKLCKHFNILINEEIEKEDADFNRISSLSNYKGKFYRLLKKNLKWCIDTDFQPFMSEFDDCLTINKEKGTDREIKLYLSSGYILPLNYNEILNSVNSLEQSIDTYTLYKKMLQEKHDIKNIKDDVLRHERKQIEILGIFAALVIFASSTTELFKGIQGFQNAAKFSLIFSYSMCSFAIVIWMISREKSKITDLSVFHIFFLALFFVATIIMFVMAFSLWPFN
ncbi:hypothetical protein [Marinifilum fragile]|uniref:hypothetical protein n=1 Tax=Marinifilum fragile TaxID=570161 RepID=UPI0006CF9768|nr:hypothetical protein [Marinifilum fragile]